MLDGADLARRMIRLRAARSLKERDPLAFWKFAVPRLREAMALISRPHRPIEELHAPACNKGTKTETQAAYVLACLQKRGTLDGVALPRWRGRVEGAQLVLDYPQQILSVQPAYLRLLGQWPHHARYKGETLSSLSVMPMGGNPRDEHEWSMLHFVSQENRKSGVGVRADIVAFDEPPRIDILRELRKAAHAGRRLVMLVHYTPTIRRQWSEIVADLGIKLNASTRSRITRIDQDRAVVRWSLLEVSDAVLSVDEKHKLLRKYLGETGLAHFLQTGEIVNPVDPIAAARIHGDAIDASGLCPFHEPTLLAMLDDCRTPETVSWRITQESDETTGRTRIARSVPVEVWEHAKVDKSYVVTIDPSSGVDDDLHDPYELEVTEMETGNLVARAGGYLSGYMVGVLAAGIARQYNGAAIDVEVNDRWGVNVVEGVSSARYGNMARERRELRPGEWSNEIGFHNNAKSRPLIIGAVQAWVDARRAGIPYGACPSRKVIETLLGCVLDADGKMVGAPGQHDECLIVRGQALRRAVRRFGRDVPDAQVPVKSHDDLLMERLRGRKASRPLAGPRYAEGRPTV